MRTLSSIAMTMLAGMALASCSEPRSGQPSTTSSLDYESPAPVTRTPLAPLGGYAASPPSPAPRETDDPPAPGWQASPRWSAIKGKGCIEVEPDPRAGQGQAGLKIDGCREGAGPAPAPQDQVESAPQDEAYDLPPE